MPARINPHQLISIIFFFIAVAAANFYGTVANAQSDRPPLPNIEIVQPDKSVPPSFAAFSGIWLGKWNEIIYTAVAVMKIRPDGIGYIKYRWVNKVGEDYTLSKTALAKIENNTLSFGTVKLTIEADNPDKAIGENYGHTQNGPNRLLSFFMKVAGTYATASPTNTSVASGSFDGVWTGSGTCRGPGTDVNVKITDGVVSGVNKFSPEGSGQISGTVGPDGTLVNGRIGRAVLSGKFDGDQFIGNYNGFREGNTNCVATLRLERQK